jgi:hypothetical protein
VGRLTKKWTICLTVLGWGCLPCLAQSALEPPDLARYVRWGALRVRPGFEVSDLGYENNIFVTSENEVGDYVATWSPKIEGLVLFGDRAFLTLKERLDYKTYLEHSDQNFLNQRGSARVTFPLRRTGFYVEGVLNRVHERPIDQLDTRRERNENGLGFGVIFVAGWRTEIEVGSSWTELSYFDEDDPNADRFDRDEFRNTIKLGYRVLGRTRATLNAYVETLDFANSESSGRDADGWGALPGINFGEGGQLSGSARVGWAEIDAVDPAFADFADVVGRADLVYRPNSRLKFRLNSVRQPGFTLSGDSIYYLDTRIGLRSVYYFNRIFGVDGGGSLGRLTFPGSQGDSLRVDRTETYEAGLRFRLAENAAGRRMEYSVRMQHRRRESTIESQNRSWTTLGVGAVLGF